MLGLCKRKEDIVLDKKKSFHISGFGVFLVILFGLGAVFIKKASGIPLFDELLIAMTLGIIAQIFVTCDQRTERILRWTPRVLIPFGLILYGAANLDFKLFAAVPDTYKITLFIAILTFLVTALTLAGLFGLKDRTGYLIASGSSVCGASAIAATASAIDAEPDDISCSLVAVFISALLGLIILFPLLRRACSMSDTEYGIFCGTVFQFTGFVKSAVSGLPAEAQKVALAVKSLRYLCLIFTIPLFTSLTKGKMSMPWYLVLFLAGGVLCSFVSTLSGLRHISESALSFIWSIAMASIGFNANMRVLFSSYGLKAFLVSFLSMLVTIGIFLVSRMVF